jgi:hypothetical protein
VYVVTWVTVSGTKSTKQGRGTQFLGLLIYLNRLLYTYINNTNDQIVQYIFSIFLTIEVLPVTVFSDTI